MEEGVVMEEGKKEVQKEASQIPIEQERTRSRKTYVPRVDIYEKKEAMVLLADMPGVDEKSVDVTLDKNVLTIRGAAEPKVCKDHSVYYSEYDVGDYERAFTITNEIDPNRIVAHVKNGVLRLTLPKAEELKVKKIAVKVS
jgi:HSP20 family protein